MDEWMDTRSQRALTSAIHRASRSSRLYDQVYACFKADKPWRRFPGTLHKASNIYKQKLNFHQGAVITVAENVP